MTDFTVLTDAELQADNPITQAQGRALRDNPLAIAEGDASAPRIQLGAIAFGSNADGAFVNGSAAPTLPGYVDYSAFTLSTPKTFPYLSIVRVQGNFTLSSTLTLASLLAADYDTADLFGVAKGNNGTAGTNGGVHYHGGGGSVGAGGDSGDPTYGAKGLGRALASLNRFWLAKRGFIGGLGGASNTGVSRGGGCLILVVNGDTDLTGGTIDASAAAVTAGAADGGAAGGGGGSIIIISRGFIKAGTLNAKGANGNGAGLHDDGGGGGGRVITVASSYPIGQTIDVSGGTGASSGLNGSAGSYEQLTLTDAQILGLLYR